MKQIAYTFVHFREKLSFFGLVDYQKNLVCTNQNSELTVYNLFRLYNIF